MREWIGFGLRGTLTSLIIAASFAGFIFLVDGIEFARREIADEKPPERGLEAYAEKISLFSLVSLGVLKISTEELTDVQRSAMPFSCSGNLRFGFDHQFIDITALTISIVAVESYNRNRVRRALEIYAQDTVQRFGGQADYTTGIGQIRSSLAEQVYRSNVNPHASSEELKNLPDQTAGAFG